MRFWLLILLVLGCAHQQMAFAPSYLLPICGHRSSASSPCSRLQMSGDGIAVGYNWHEEAFELEVSVKVPPKTRAKDILFKATTNSIDLRLKQSDENTNNNDDQVLLDPKRALRGRISVEGTFWVISDPDPSHRLVTVTIEKLIRTPKDDFDVIDYDWKGLYLQEEPNEVSFRRYDEAEELNVREYAASLGVDIDNLNMSLVDKTMFTSGLNLTQSSLNSLKDAGLVQEVTRQGDGSEWTTDDNGEQTPFSPLGIPVNQTRSQTKPTIPFLDTNSPWHTAIPVDEQEDFRKTTTTTTTSPTSATEEPTIAAPATNTAETKRAEKMAQLQKQRQQQASDPIETLTVARLKEILKARGLKVTGNKKELQDRLRNEVSLLMTTTTLDSDTIDQANESNDNNNMP